MDDELRRREHENWGRAVNRSYGWVQSPAEE
jgi:glycerol kinase